MTTNPVNPNDPDILASDHDRSAAEDRLRAAVESGRLPVDELAGRLDTVHAARTRGALAEAVRGLPAPGPRDALVVDGRRPSSGVLVGIFGGFDRRGPWLVPPRMTTVSLWGGGRVDLTDARFSEPDTVIRSVALWGGTAIVVPDDVEVEVRGFGLFGVFGGRGSRKAGRPGGPRVVIKGLALFGAVVVRDKDA